MANRLTTTSVHVNDAAGTGLFCPSLSPDIMAAPLSASLPSDSFLYRFTPATCGRGAMPQPPTPMSARRLRAQSVTGEPTHRLDGADSSTDPQAAPRSPGTLHLPGRAPAPGPALGSCGRSGSADRQSMAATLASLNNNNTPATAAAPASPTAVASVMPLIGSGGGGGGGSPGSAGGPRHGAAAGLPKLAGGPHGASAGGGVASSVELPALMVTGAGVRRLSNSGGDDGTASTAAAAAAALDSPVGGADVATVASSRQGMVLAPLRPGYLVGVGVLPGGGGGGSPTTAAAAAALLDGGGGGGAKSHGWCGGGGGGGGGVSGGSRRSSIAGPLDIGPLVLPYSGGGGGGAGGLHAAAACDSPSLPVTPATAPLPPPRRSHSPSCPTTLRRGLSLRLHCEERNVIASDNGSDGDASDASDSYGSCGGSGSTTVAHLRSINDDLQRAAGALSALHSPLSPSRAPKPDLAAAPAPAALTAHQLATLQESAPELHCELRIAVRRAFQVICQEVAAASPRGRKLSICVHECWATLDAFLEGTAELTSALVDGWLEATACRAAERHSQPSASQLSRGAAGGSAGAPERSDVGPRSTGGGNRRYSCDDAFNLPHGPALQEVERLRAVNADLQKQLEGCQRRLAALEGKASPGDVAGADIHAGTGATGASPPYPYSGPTAAVAERECGGVGPRPPAAFVSRSLESCYGPSPRRGKLARSQQQQQQRVSDSGIPGGSSSSGGAGGCEGANTHAFTCPSPPLDTCGSGARRSLGSDDGGGGGGAGSLPRESGRGALLARTSSVVEGCGGGGGGGRQVTFATTVTAGGGSNGGGGGGGGGGDGNSGDFPRLFGRVGAAAGPPGRINSHAELVIEEEDSEEDGAGLGPAAAAAATGSVEARRRGLIHSASFAEWMEGRLMMRMCR